MLLMTNDTQTLQPQLIPPTNYTQTNLLQHTPQTQQTEIRPPRIQSKPAPILCNFCQKPNHTWDVCRTRMANSNMYNSTPNFNTKPQFQPQQNQFSPRRPFQTNQFSPQKQFQTNQYPSQNQFQQRQYTQQAQPQRNQYQPNNYSNQNNRYPQTPNSNSYRQPPRQSNYQPKYCSHCKTTTGHTFEECRNKFYATSNVNTNNYAKPQQNSPIEEGLEQKFTNMRINQLYSLDEYQHTQPPDEIQNQGNSPHSDPNNHNFQNYYEPQQINHEYSLHAGIIPEMYLDINNQTSSEAEQISKNYYPISSDILSDKTIFKIN